MADDTCSSDLLALKLQQLNALLQVVRRTLDSNEGSIYLNEAINLMGAAGEMTQDCEDIRKRIDVELYQQSSKYYGLYGHSGGRQSAG
ncbi:hypothetical protein [Kluyvera intermedia]|uniref:hypothetical protein n=1 Tax=Kluyvera intermedia TaxID=61648 RepID=UPI00372D2E81